MRLYPDYQKPIQEALIVLEDSGINRFPVDLSVIQRQYHKLFEIRSYGSLMRKSKISREECCELLGSEDGASVSDGCGRYILYYNENMTKRRTRFTIAHEFGHIFLGHHDEYGEPILKRGGVGKALYERLEKEANCFARNLLCPAYHTDMLLEAHGIRRVVGEHKGWKRITETKVTENLTSIFHPEDLIEAAFDVSPSAAIARLGFLNADINKYCTYKLDWKSTKSIGHTASWYCSRCGLERTPGAAYCSECGKKHFAFQVNITGYRYPDIGMNEHHQFSYCPVCGNHSYLRDAKYCRICGTPLRNPCKRDPAHLNAPAANHCSICGKPTEFKGTNYHAQIQENIIKTSEGAFPMIYESDIKFDHETNKVEECPRCHNELFSENAMYCRICGLVLKNTCIPEPEQDSYGNYYDPEPHQNAPDARFCETCGAKTVYLSNGILKAYKEILDESEGD